MEGGSPKITEVETELSEGVRSEGEFVSLVWEEAGDECWVCGMEEEGDVEEDGAETVKVEADEGEVPERFGAVRDERGGESGNS